VNETEITFMRRDSREIRNVMNTALQASTLPA